MKHLFAPFFIFGCIASVCLAAVTTAHGATLAIDSLSGAVTQNEINSFITYIQAQTPPPTPWGALNGTGHNDWADGTGGRDLEAMGEMYEVSSNVTILNVMVSWSDYCTSQRNDLMSAANGGQRVMWTGLIDKVWCPNWPTDMTDNQYLYCGCETEDVIGHLAFCAKLILQNQALWNVTVPDGNPFGYGATYYQRATNYLAKCDEANDEYFLKWFIQPGTSLIVAPTNAAWTSLNENVNANNRQMMFTSGFQRLAEAHEILGDNSARVAQYDAIVKASVNQCLTGMVNFHPYTTNGQAVYDWGYYPTKSAPEATEIHAEYDMIGVWRAFNRPLYGFTLPPLIPFANTMVDVIYLGTNTFALNVDGSGGIQGTIYSGWILPADWNPQVYTTVAGAALAKGWYKSSADIDAGILLMKNRRFLEFSLTPSPAKQIVQAGAGTSFSVAVAPLGGFTNSVSLSLSGLPAGVTGGFSPASVNLAALSLATTNVTLSLSTSGATPTGTYTVNLIGTSGGVSRTNIVSLIVGNYSVSVSPPSQTVSAGTAVSYTVSVATNSGFSGSVALGVSGLPANTSAAFSPASLSGAGNSTLTLTTSNSTPAGNYVITIAGTNGSVVANTTASLVIVGATPVWTGGSSSDNNWSDAANWGGTTLAPSNTLIFNGVTRLNNTNDTAAGTVYSNIVFSPGAGAFVLNGHATTLGGNITNNSANPQTINFGLNFNGNFTFNGASNLLTIGGGLTNQISGSAFTTLNFAGSGQLVNLFGDTISPGGTNVILVNDPAANWTLLDNASSRSITVPWVFEVNQGIFNYGAASSAPVLTSTAPNKVPSDHLVGTVLGATGTFNMISGTLTTSGRFDTATSGNSTGVINQSGGTFNMGSQFQGANGSNPGEVSIVNVLGGTMNINSGTGPFFVASRGTGTLTVGGDGVVNCGTLDISRNADGSGGVSSAGTVNLDGGSLMVTSVTNLSANQQTGGTPTAAFNFNGGTLVAKAGAPAGFFQGCTVAPVTPITIMIQENGAFIDDGGNAISILEPLQHDSSVDPDLDGGLTKLNTGTLTLTTPSTYNGETLVNAGTLALSGAASIENSTTIAVNAGAILDASVRSDAALTLTSGQMLTGNGTVKGNVVVGNGAMLAPGGSLNNLTFQNNLTLNGGSMTVMELSKSPTTNDSAQVAGTVTFAGTLMLTNASSNAFAAGDSFRLFNAASYTGTFTNVTPAVPQPGLQWDTTSLTLNGTLKIAVAPQPVIAGVSVAGANLVLSGTNGPSGETFWVLGSTDLTQPLSNWTILSTNAFDNSGSFILTNPAGAGGQSFFILQLQ